ncbi:MAG: restriction endonuclease subunit S, partial [Phycisphaerales bacterium]|nr:restriction endonuclease subunit S [Phycisphaerales bacterium]
AEQKRIAAILDKADAIRRRRQEAARLADTLIPSVFYEMFGDPRANNNNLPLRPFGELATNEDGRRRPVKAFDRSMRSGPYPYYGASGIIDHVEEFIFDETTLLIAEDGANLLARSTPIAFIATGKYWVNNHAHVVTPNGQAELGYLETHLNLRDVTDFVTGSAQPKLTQANLNRLPVPYPPIEQQKEFAQRVRRVANLKKAQAVERSEAEQLFRSLVQRAFRGEL